MNIDKSNGLSCCAGLILAGLIMMTGCVGEKTGKFTEEQLAEIPLRENDNLPAPSGGIVLNVKGEAITSQEVIAPIRDLLRPIAKNNSYESFRDQASLLISREAIGKVTDVLLYAEARNKAAENIDEALEKAVEQEVNKFVADYGSDYSEAQKAIESLGYNWQEFRDYKKKFLLVQWYYSQELKNEEPITHSELAEYYESVKEERFKKLGEVEFRLIDIVSSKLETPEPAGSDEKKRAAIELAREVMGKINSGQDFGELAEEYSHGHRAAMGGLWRPVTEGSGLVEPYDVLLNEMKSMNVGDVRGPLESGEHVFILKIESKTESGYERFRDVQPLLESELELKRQRLQFDKMVGKLIRQADIADMDNFVNFCIVLAYRQLSSG